MTISTVMASLASAPTSLCSTCASRKAALHSLPSCHKTPKSGHLTRVSQLGLAPFYQWSGLRNMGVSITPKSLNKEKRGRFRNNKVVHASLFGVGAPEAFVIGVVALLVFGPKGLAEVARNLGKTLREFQPTIRELQEVSREFKSTLEQEIGLNDTSSPPQNTYSSNRTNAASTPSSVGSTETSTVTDTNVNPSPNRAYTSDEYLKITEEQLKAASSARQQGQTSSPGESLLEPDTQPQATVKETAGGTPPPQKPENEV